ncbi:MAG TPA: ABC transporter ATP-binding protein [Gammaproteobacteria bacterium]|nr:ABC transporter ATP-binding protein [Gammaproteobacteria bacterium]
MNSPADVLIEAEGLSRRYGDLLAVDGVSLRLLRGEVLGLLGPNGAGKSSTLQMLTGALAASTGSVRVAGHDLDTAPLAARAALGFLPEQPPVYRELKVDEYLAYCARLRRVPAANVTSAVLRAKARSGLDGVGHRLIGRLSKGFQQRVGIAQAIIHNPPVVILDEPTVGLDPIQQREIRGLIRELGREHGVILSTHILPEVQAVCDRVIILHQGRVVLDEALSDLAATTGGGLRLDCERPPAATVIERLPGVTAVACEGTSCRIATGPGFNTRSLLEAALAGDWGVLSLVPERRSLEELFVQLTCGEAA